jgi:hypothetical protein
MPTTLIDFEDRTEGDFITTQYQSRGLTVLTGGSIHTKPSTAHSPKNYLAIYHTEFTEAPPVLLQFQTGQQRVRLWSGTESTPAGTTVVGDLWALDSQGNTLDHDGPRFIQPNVCNTAFEVKNPSSAITKVMLGASAFDKQGNPPFRPDQIVDDIEFEQPSPIPLPPNQQWAIIFGIVAGSGGIRLGPTGPEPWPPPGPEIQPTPEVTDILLTLSLSEVARLLTNPAAVKKIRRAALQSAAQELTKLTATLDAAKNVDAETKSRKSRVRRRPE